MAVQLSEFSSPLGQIAVAECRGRVLAIEFGDLSELLCGCPGLRKFDCHTAGSMGSAARALKEFLATSSGPLKVKVDLSLVERSFDREVLRSLFRTRPGSTLTYGELATRVGRPKAARAVGGAMRRNPIPIAIPCHRVLPSAGGLGNYTGGAEKKAWLLAREGVRVTS